MGTLVLPALTVGQPVRQEDVDLVNALLACQTEFNGHIDVVNLATSLKAALGINDATTRHGYHQVLTQETTASTSEADLATDGPTVTVTLPAGGGLVIATADLEMHGSGANSVLAWLKFGSAVTDVVQQTNNASFSSFQLGVGTLGGVYRASGATTVKMRYSVDAGTGTFRNRKLSVTTMGF